jgi:hypothetical protein
MNNQTHHTLTIIGNGAILFKALNALKKKFFVKDFLGKAA